MAERAAVSVAVRVRPFTRRELDLFEEDEIPFSIVMFRDRHVDVLNSEGEVDATFHYDRLFWSIPADQLQLHSRMPFAGQDEVFQDIGAPSVRNVFLGYHSCILAYGQTGSGKTHTMLGSPAEPGVAPRVIRELYRELDERQAKREAWEYSVSISFLEIYNERVKDLLVAAEAEGSPVSPMGSASPRRVRIASGHSRSSLGEGRSEPSDPGAESREASPPGTPTPGTRGPSTRQLVTAVSFLARQSRPRRRTGGNSGSPAHRDQQKGYQDLKVRQSKDQGTFVEGLTIMRGITDAVTVIEVMKHGMQHRAQAATAMNEVSSRSHAIFQVCLTMRNGAVGVQRYAHINLVDLAGSERLKMSKSEGMQLKEATRINLSLSTLRRVIDVLVENGARRKSPGQPGYHVPPYRDSLLTWVLSESLGGNSKTTMIATVSPHESNREDTMNTLRYAFKAKDVVNVVRVNDTKTNVVLTAMQKEMQLLRQQLEDPTVVRTEKEVEDMREKERFLSMEIDEYEDRMQGAKDDIEQQRKHLHAVANDRRKMSLAVRQLRQDFDDDEYDELMEEEQELNKELHEHKRRLSVAARRKHSVEGRAKQEAAEMHAADEGTRVAMEGAAEAFGTTLGLRCKTWRMAWMFAFKYKERQLIRQEMEEDIQTTVTQGNLDALDIARAEQRIGDLRALCARMADRVRHLDAVFDARYTPGGKLDSSSEHESGEQRDSIAVASAEGVFLEDTPAGSERAAVQDSVDAAEHQLARVLAALRKQKRQLAALQREAEAALDASPRAAADTRIDDLRRRLEIERDRARRQRGQLEELSVARAASEECAAVVQQQNRQLRGKAEALRQQLQQLREESTLMRAENEALNVEHARMRACMRDATQGLDEALRRRHSVAHEAGARGLQHRDLRRFAEEHFFADDRGARLAPSHSEQRRVEEELGYQFEGCREWIQCGYRYRPASPRGASQSSVGRSDRTHSPARRTASGDNLAPSSARGNAGASAPASVVASFAHPSGTSPGAANGSMSRPAQRQRSGLSAPRMVRSFGSSGSTSPRDRGPEWSEGPPLQRRIVTIPSAGREPPPPRSVAAAAERALSAQ
eukprot:TRINITY_DN13175_c1_g1_i2.p1 TRINITY_DN13175_c1_g1~~TRINITY_DN13175_c1_g1_i2.p1  ORF type:complete len:1117 (+),score=358.14 TRINITY_DN13175_c1_g1_i2:78-3353(+)